jgi:hypothetical protein
VASVVKNHAHTHIHCLLVPGELLSKTIFPQFCWLSMTKAEAIAAVEKHRHLKGKSVVKKESNDTSKYLVKEVAALPFGQKLTDIKLVTRPDNFSGYDWQVYAIIEPHTNFFVKIDAEELEKNYRLV